MVLEQVERSRREMWCLSPKWKMSKNGNYYRKDCGIVIVLNKKTQNWTIIHKGKFWPASFPSLKAAIHFTYQEIGHTRPGGFFGSWDGDIEE